MENLRQIPDGSLDDIEFPQDPFVQVQLEIKKEFVDDFDNPASDASDIDVKNDILDESKEGLDDIQIKS